MAESSADTGVPTSSSGNGAPLLEIEGLCTFFHTDEGVVKSVNDVSFHAGVGETVGIVGESGCGKSVTALSIMRLIATPPGRIEGGTIRFDGADSLLFPTPRDVVGRDEVLVGRVRRDLESDRLWLWQVSDNLRKGAATNAVQIAEVLRQRPPVLRR